MPNSIGLEDIYKAYGPLAVLKGFSFSVPQGGRLSLMGPSGCGKTTAIRLLLGLEQPDAGNIIGMEGIRAACLFQENRLLPTATAIGNVAAPLKGKGARQEAQEWLVQVGLGTDGDKLPGELSGGMRRRVALARALCCPADLLLLDEPLKEMDKETRERMLALIARSVNGRTLLLITHDRGEAEALNCPILNM